MQLDLASVFKSNEQQYDPRQDDLNEDPLIVIYQYTGVKTVLAKAKYNYPPLLI